MQSKHELKSQGLSWFVHSISVITTSHNILTECLLYDTDLATSNVTRDFHISTLSENLQLM